MSPGKFRKLTPGEVELARLVFGDQLDAGKVTIFALPIWNRAFVTGRHLMVWPAATASLDFSTAPLQVKSVFIHELTHVWQAQSGVNLILAKLAAGDGHRAYAYDLSENCAFQSLNIEQQAMIIQHAFLAAHGEETPFKFHAYSVVLADWPESIFSNPQQV
ncbi:MAG: hypothetical protein WCO83_08430 [Alphaproteobacteria bacterium]